MYVRTSRGNVGLEVEGNLDWRDQRVGDERRAAEADRGCA